MSAGTAVDLFCGAGGASMGLTNAGFDLRLSADIDPACGLTHSANLAGEFLVGDIRDLDADKVLNTAGISTGELDLLFAGPPCQGFSILGARVIWDERNNLYREVLRLAGDLRPRCVVVENVPGLVPLAQGAYLRAIMQGLSDKGYDTSCAELLAAQYGAPQMRWRLIIIGWRRDLGIPPGYGFPAPSAGTGAIGDLLPNCTITTQETQGFVTTRQAISDLPVIAAGEERGTYLGPPCGSYQQAMRENLRDELFNHYAARLSPANLKRLAMLKPGQDWRDLPAEMLPPGMRRALRKDHTRRYRRMTWDGVPRAVITRFRDPKSGEYTHPEQDRTISIREAARLQGFPDRFIFHGDRSSQYDQVGNAVPVQLAQAIAQEVRRCLDGQLGCRLAEPFRRRPVPLIGSHGELIALRYRSAQEGHLPRQQERRMRVSQPPSRRPRTSAPREPRSTPHVSEWFGHRVFPTVDTAPTALRQQRSKLCPFLSETLEKSTPCVKKESSRGVCTISASSNGPRQDWLVCPYRALDPNLLTGMVRRLYSLPDQVPVLIRPAKALENPEIRQETLLAVRPEDSRRVFLYFQDILGGEISLPRTSASPELSFDITVIELLPADSPPALIDAPYPAVRVGKYGVIELQTTDTHGSYLQAVTALTNALDLHPAEFHRQLAANPDWAGRKVEGPNISNVFKRTFYQIAFKFQVTKRDTSTGCVLALPQPVWDSWQPFLGAPQLSRQDDGTWRLLDDHQAKPVDWIYVFDIDDQPPQDGKPAALKVPLVIGTDASTLSHAAFDIAPAKAVENEQGIDAVVTIIHRRLAEYIPRNHVINRAISQ